MITEDEGRSVAVLVGEFVARYRKTHRITRDNLARAGAAFGMTWGRTSIENIEAGRFAPTIATLYALQAALSSQVPGASPICLPDMLATDGLIQIADGYAITAPRLHAFLGDGEVVEMIGDWAEDAFRSLVAAPAPPPTLAEQRAAKKLGIGVDDLRDMAWFLWGEPLDQLIDQEVGRDATPQARGHANRAMVAELKERMPDLMPRVRAMRAERDG